MATVQYLADATKQTYTLVGGTVVGGHGNIFTVLATNIPMDLTTRYCLRMRKKGGKSFYGYKNRIRREADHRIV